MEEFINVVTLEDGIEYAIIDEIESNSTKYLYLSNVEDSDDFCIRKLALKDNEQVLIGLDDDAEFDLALMLFAKNHKEDIETVIPLEN